MLKVRRPKRPEIQWPLTALIDIVFLLLIYFLLTTNFLTDEGLNVHLPKAKTAAPQQEEPLNIYVKRSGTFFFQGHPVSASQLLQALRKELAHAPQRVVMIKADRKVTLDKAVKALDLARAAGAQKVFLATEEP